MTATQSRADAISHWPPNPEAKMSRLHYVGLMSGTSMDGIDVALVAFTDQEVHATPTVLAGSTEPFSDELNALLLEAKSLAETDHHRLLGSALHRAVDQQLAEAFASAGLKVIEASGLNPSMISAIGSHGQTLIHRPDDSPPISLQLGDPGLIAKLTGIPTVAQFRQADLLAGGQGAPLAPLLHQALFRHPSQSTGVLNLGGIANITVLKPNQPVLGFDTGPANVWLDLWYRRHHGHGFDVNGGWASSGQVIDALVESVLADEYFRRPPPKSTSIEYFGVSWLDRIACAHPQARPQDIQASLSSVTVKSVVHALNVIGGVDRLILCGGGAHNIDLVSRLNHTLPSTEMMMSDALGVSSDHLEAALFAWLARERLAQRTFDTSSITGARHPVLLGETFLP